MPGDDDEASDSTQARVTASRRAQGLPDKVEDRATLALVAAILTAVDAEHDEQ